MSYSVYFFQHVIGLATEAMSGVLDWHLQSARSPQTPPPPPLAATSTMALPV